MDHCRKRHFNILTKDVKESVHANSDTSIFAFPLNNFLYS